MLRQRDGLQLGIDLKRNRLVIPVKIMRARPDALVGMPGCVMISPRGFEFTVLHDAASLFLSLSGPDHYRTKPTVLVGWPNPGGNRSGREPFQIIRRSGYNQRA